MINVVLSSDDNYAPYLGVTIYSLLKNNQGTESLKIFILDNNISKLNKNKLIDIVNIFNNSVINFIKVKNIEKYAKIESRSRLTLATFARLFLSSLLPDNIDKVIYLDCDALVLNSLNNIWNLNLKNYYCAGVIDLAPLFFKEEVGLFKNDNYINAGFLLINLKKWREDNVELKFINYLEKHEGKVLNSDQGVVNAIFKNKILIINPSYNLMPIFFEYDYDEIITMYDIKNFYSKKVIKDSKNNVVFLHFADFLGKPWFKNFNHPCKNFYLGYASKTPFNKEVHVEGNISFRIKLLNFLKKHLPSIIFANMYKIYSKTFFKLLK